MDLNDVAYARIGLAAMLPGMQHMIELMQAELDRMRRMLTGLQETPAKKKMGRPRKVKSSEPEVFRSGWPADPEERKLEMRRRVAKRGQKAKAEAKSAKLSKLARERWNNMSAREKKAKLKKMTAARYGKKAKAKKARKVAPVFELAQVS